tara:strand:- start:122 stop:373 length:252 start_codon:yes stop_codon:yes gene_type:complete
MNSNEIQQALQPILNKIKKDSFTNPNNATDIDAFSLLVSKYFEWSGEEIARVGIDALDDANFHKLALEFKRAFIMEFPTPDMK